MLECLSNSQTRAVLMRKLMTICPTCGKLIFGRDIDLTELENSQGGHWPVKYNHHHSHNQGPIHAITLYIDANFTVRAREVPKMMNNQY